MKLFRWLLPYCVLVLLFTACDKKEGKVEPGPEEKTNGNIAAPGQLIAKVNDTLFTSQMAFVGNASPNGLTIYGQSNSKMIYLSIGGNITKPGRFDAFAYNSVVGWFTKTNNSTAHTWTSITTNKCQLIITKVDWAAKKMSGSFAFVADSQAASAPTGTYRITEGSFTDLPINVAAPAATVKMEAQVDNVPWSASGMYIYGSPGYYDLYGSDANGKVVHVSGIDLQSGSNSTINSYASYSEPVSNDFNYWIANGNPKPTIQVTKYDPVSQTASGTFSFSAEASGLGTASGIKNISQGTFTDVPVF